MSEQMQYYADGCVVCVGDIVEIDVKAAYHSYSGWVYEMTSLVGVELEVVGVKTTSNPDIAILTLKPVHTDEDDRVIHILRRWNFSSDMFVLSSKCDVDMADTAGLTEFLEEV